MLRNIPSSTLKELVRLSERKEALLAQIQAIDREINRVQNRFGIPSREPSEPAEVTVSRVPSRSTVARAKRGMLKQKIVSALHGAGKKGATVRELSAKLH